MIKKLFLPILFLISIVIFSNCQKELDLVDSAPILPTLITTAITSITETTAQSGGNINDDGGAMITARGVCWNTSANPTTANNKTADGSGTGVYSSSISGLTAGVTYYVRAYATNSAGTSYGNEISFTTTTTPGLPSLTTTAVTSITDTTALSGGNITSEGSTAVIARGVCWSTSANPTTANNKTEDGTGMGVFSSSISGLTVGVTYYVRAYATNSAGTAYGNEVSYTTTTIPILPTLTTTAITSITGTTAQSGGNITADGGAAVIARGVCWSTSANPTTANNKTTDGSGTGVYTSSISGLAADVTYYVRAYATNSTGTAYGNEVSFTTTTTPVLPTLTTTAVTFITGTTAQSGGNITAGGSTSVIARGVCWSTSANPTIANSRTTDGSGTGVYASSINGLTAGATYYVRAYATNSAGTAYGNEVSFTTTSTPGSGDVYVAGYDNGVAKIWKNGVSSSLTNGFQTYALSIYVSGTDVYVTGQENINNTWIAKVWKNGVATSLTNGINSAGGNSIYVSGTDVYVAGYEDDGFVDIAKVWKNGVATSLTNGSGHASGTSVYVSGTDVYVAGTESMNGSNNVAKVWKNGVATSLTNGSQDAFANSVFVLGTDVYAAGYEGNVAKVWKNGVATLLGSNNARAYSVYVSGTDVYVAGYEGTVAKIWKNGVATSLTNGSGPAYARSVYVSGTDVYIAGEQREGTRNVAKFWKNGVATSLTNGSNDGGAYSIFVK